jgi:hypothetical protein
MSDKSQEEELSPEQLDICSHILRGVADLIDSKPGFNGCNIPAMINGSHYNIKIMKVSENAEVKG